MPSAEVDAFVHPENLEDGRLQASVFVFGA